MKAEKKVGIDRQIKRAEKQLLHAQRLATRSFKKGYCEQEEAEKYIAESLAIVDTLKWIKKKFPKPESQSELQLKIPERKKTPQFF
jgi:hypothetical protein